MTARRKPSYVELKRKLNERTPELAEWPEQQAATAEILRVTSSSPADIQPVLDMVAFGALSWCARHALQPMEARKCQ